MFSLLLLAAIAALTIFLVRMFVRRVSLSSVFRAVFIAPLMILLALPAVAQEAGAPGFIEAILPQLLELLGIVLMFFLTWASARFTRRTGIEIEARYREAMHSALMTGAHLALNRKLTGPAAIDLIVTHVRQSVPDALGKLQPSGSFLERMAEAKLQEAGDKLARELSRAIGR
jgi:hypothetical protein